MSKMQLIRYARLRGNHDYSISEVLNVIRRFEHQLNRLPMPDELIDNLAFDYDEACEQRSYGDPYLDPDEV